MSDAEQREEAVFEAALQCQGAERVAYLDGACAGDPALRERIEGLLGALERAGGLLSEPAVPRDQAAQAIAPPPIQKPGDRLDGYKLLQQIGEGGCGVVYMAEQEEPIRRRVALKILKLGMDTKQVIARFEAERQALALMDHPNIAKVLDAGATGTGRPYFVMELVRGVKITDYCDENKVTTQDRLKLFLQVCQAIQHAHQKGIIHRDIKPSNILVTVNDGVPLPKVIDFGIAKATSGQPLTDKTLFTAFEQFIGTPAYMSPEQAVMTSVDIDTRSDIYSLGVLLYELLTGKTPFDTRELLQAGFDEMRRTIREKEPARPSTRLSTMIEGELTTTAKRRHTDAPKLVHLVRGDLDWIVMKCLEKDRARRYASANGLAADLQRHLSNEPVVARPPNTAYRFQKMVHRNRLGFVAVAAVLIALLLGLAVSIHLLIREQAAQRNARSELLRSQQVTAFLQATLDDVSPELNQGRETRVRDILDRAASRASVELTNQPEVQARVLTTIAGVYDKLADYAKAESLCREALRLQESVVGSEDQSIAELLNHLSLVQIQRGDAAGAAISLHRAVAMLKKFPLQTNPALVDALANLASLQFQSGDLLGAEATLREALDLTAHVPEAGAQAAMLRSHLGRVLETRGDLAGAEKLFRETLEFAAKLLPPDHPLVATTLGNLGLIQWDRGNLEDADKSFRDKLDRMTRILGDAPHPELANSFNNLALVLRDRGNLEEAESLQRRALNFMMLTVGPSHPDTGLARGNLAVILRRRGALAPDQALSLFREAVQLNPDEEMNSDALACWLARKDLMPLTADGTSNPAAWRYTFTLPPTNWMAIDFRDVTWATEPTPRGFTNCVPRSNRAAGARTNIWLRREFILRDMPVGTLAILAGRNHDARVFVNGVEAVSTIDWGDAPILRPCSSGARAALRPGRNVLAVHCQDADGNAPFEVGLFVTSDASLGRDRLIAEFSRMIEKEPYQAGLYACRGKALARSGRFGEAFNDLNKAAELTPADSVLPFQISLLLLATNDVAGFRLYRAKGLNSLERASSPQTPERIARIALLSPAAGSELDAAARLADQAAAADYADGGLAFRQLAKALAEYRRAHFADAIGWAGKAIATSTQPNRPGWSNERQRIVSATAHLVAAMSHQNMGENAEAATAFAQANRIVTTQFPPLDGGDLGRAWPDLLMARILLHEARQVMEGKMSPKVEQP